MPLRRSASKVEVLERLPLLAGLSQKEFERISRLAKEIEVPAGR